MTDGSGDGGRLHRFPHHGEIRGRWDQKSVATPDVVRAKAQRVLLGKSGARHLSVEPSAIVAGHLLGCTPHESVGRDRRARVQELLSNPPILWVCRRITTRVGHMISQLLTYCEA